MEDVARLDVSVEQGQLVERIDVVQCDNKLLVEVLEFFFAVAQFQVLFPRALERLNDFFKRGIIILGND